MGISSSALSPDDLISFKKLLPGTKLDEISIPERPENRTPTNRKWSFIFLGFIILLMPFLIYTLAHSDVRRLYKSDPCGNICGEKNTKYDDISCSGQDMTFRKYIKYISSKRECVADCGDGYDVEASFGICVVRRSYSDGNVGAVPLDGEIEAFFNKVAWQLTVGSFISLAIAITMLFLFRYAVAAVVWTILIGCLVAFTIVVIYLWYLYPTFKNKDYQNASGFLYFNIILSIVVIVLALILIVARKKIWLVIALLKETTKAVFALPGIIFVPVTALGAELILLIIFVVIEVYLFSAGYLTHVGENYIYKPDVVMMFTIAFSIAIFIWIMQFITGIKYMVIAGAVSDWYFAKNKQYLNGPIMRSVGITFKYHLGTVAFGSFIITLIMIIRALITSAIKNEHFKRFMDSCCKSIATFLKFLSKNAYIVTALHGQPFMKSGKRAAKLLIQNVGDVVAINSIGDFVLGMAQLLIVILSVAITYGLLLLEPASSNQDHLLIALAVMAIIATLIAATIFSVFETTIDTIFICFCEDSLMNDGMSRPYCMSTDLMEFVQNSKKIYAKS